MVVSFNEQPLHAAMASGVRLRSNGGRVPRHTFTMLIADTQGVLCVSIPLVRRSLVQFHRTPNILRHTVTILITETQADFYQKTMGNFRRS